MTMSGKMEHFLAVDKNSPTQASASMLEKESSEGISVLHKFAPMYENIQYVDFDTKSCEILNIAVRLLDCQLVNERHLVNTPPHSANSSHFLAAQILTFYSLTGLWLEHTSLRS